MAYACRAVEVAYCPRQRRCGFDAGVEERFDVVGSEHLCGDVREFFTHAPAIARDGDAGVLVALVEVVGQALCGAGDGVDVHAVGAGANDTAQPTGAKLEVLKERVGKGGFIVLHGGKLGLEAGVCALQPAGVLLLGGHGALFFVFACDGHGSTWCCLWLFHNVHHVPIGATFTCSDGGA